MSHNFTKRPLYYYVILFVITVVVSGAAIDLISAHFFGRPLTQLSFNTLSPQDQANYKLQQEVKETLKVLQELKEKKTNATKDITYEVPSAWKRTSFEDQDDYGIKTTRLTSPDYASSSASILQTDGTKIDILYAPFVNSGANTDPYDALEAVVAYNYPLAKNIERTTFEDIPILSYENTLYPNLLTPGTRDNEKAYIFYKNGGSWRIAVQYGGTTQAEIDSQKSKYKSIIEEFLTSIHLN